MCLFLHISPCKKSSLFDLQKIDAQITKLLIPSIHYGAIIYLNIHYIKTHLRTCECQNNGVIFWHNHDYMYKQRFMYPDFLLVFIGNILFVFHIQKSLVLDNFRG